MLLEFTESHSSHCSSHFCRLGSLCKINIWRPELECNGHLCRDIFFSSCQLCSKSSFFHLVRWSGKRKRWRVDATPWRWFTIPLVFKDCQWVTSWHLNSLPKWSYAKTVTDLSSHIFLLSKTSTSGIICCNLLGKKFHKLIRWWLTLWAFFSLLSVI